jgi:hypothetical protein
VKPSRVNRIFVHRNMENDPRSAASARCCSGGGARRSASFFALVRQPGGRCRLDRRAMGTGGSSVYSALLVLQLIVAFVPGQALVFAGGYVVRVLEIPARHHSLSRWSAARSRFISLAATGGLSPTGWQRNGRSTAGSRSRRIRGSCFISWRSTCRSFPPTRCATWRGWRPSLRGAFSSRIFWVRTVSTVFTVMVGAYGLNLPTAFWAVAILTVAGFYLAWVAYARKRKIDVYQKN